MAERHARVRQDRSVGAADPNSFLDGGSPCGESLAMSSCWRSDSDAVATRPLEGAVSRRQSTRLCRGTRYS